MVARNKRFSRTVPWAMGTAQRDSFLALLNSDAQLREDMETLLGVDTSRMTDVEKINALRNYEEASWHKALYAQMARADIDLHNAAATKRGDIALRDTVTLLEAELDEKDERIRTLETKLAETRMSARRRVLPALPPTTQLMETD